MSDFYAKASNLSLANPFSAGVVSLRDRRSQKALVAAFIVVKRV